MTRRKHKLQRRFLVLLFATLAGVASAQTPLTLDQAMQLGLDNSKSLKISELNVTTAREKYNEVNASRFASLELKGGYTRLSSIPGFDLSLPANLFGPGFPPRPITYPISQFYFNYYNLQLQLQQPIFTGFQLLNSAKAAKRTAEATSFDTRADKSNLKVQIASAYWTLYAAIQAQNVMQENLDRTKSHYKQAVDLMNQGMLTQSDVLSAKVQLSNSQLSLLDAENNVRLAAVSLNNVLGVPLNTDYVIKSTPQTGDTTLPHISRLLHTAIENRPELQSLDLKSEAADAAVKVAWGAYLPQISLFGDYYYQRPNQRFQPPQDVFKGTWDAGVLLSLPIWNWGQTQDKVDQANAQYQQSRLAVKQMADGVYLQVTQSYLNFKQAVDKIKVAGETVKDAEESYRISDQKFKVGLVTNTDLMDAEMALLQAKLNYTQALTGLEIARINLEQSTGQL